LLIAFNKDKTKEATTEQKDKPMVAAASTTTNDKMPDSAMQAKNWQEYMTPGKEHQMLKEACGNWTADITSWMAAGAPAKKSTGKEESKMIMGDRYQQSHMKSTFGGMPFEGLSTIGFDNKKKVYEAIWVDNMGTGIMKMEGSWDVAKNQ